MADRVVVRAPATVANLGPAFDAMGLALGWFDEVRVERHDGPLEITASGLGAEGIRRDETSSLYVGVRALLGEGGVKIHKTTAVAFGRGFGSSAISIVAGLVAGRALAESDHSDEDLLAIAIEMEGHADNVAPCLLGGITVVSGRKLLRLEPANDLRVLTCVAPTALATKAARAAVPDAVPRGVAAAGIARAALLAASIATGRTDTLLEATDDLLHQPPRFELMPETGRLVRALRAEGIAAFLSGAGPSVAALVDAEHAAGAGTIAKRVAPEAWEVRIQPIDLRGAEVVEVS